MDVPVGFSRAQEALSLWRRIGDPIGEIRTLTVLASFQYRQDNIKEMTASLEEALSLSLAVHDERGEAGASWMLAAFAKPDQETRARYFERSLELWRNLGEIGEQARVLHEKGAFEFNQAKSAEAMVSWEEALGLAEKGASDLIPDILNGIGGIYSGRGESGKALECFERSLGLARQESRPGAEAAILTSIGVLLRRRGELQPALTNFLMALEFNEHEQLFVAREGFSSNWEPSMWTWATRTRLSTITSEPRSCSIPSPTEARKA